MLTAARRVFDTIFPPVCVLCGGLAAGPDTGVCARCDAALPRILPPYCRVCGAPFESGLASRACLDCMSDPPPYALARAPLRYEGEARRSILAFKFRLGVHRARGFADLLASVVSMGVTWSDFDIAAPVPLHPRRLRERGYNPPLLIARRLLRQTPVALRPELMQRVRDTPPQRGLSRAGRRDNVRSAFAVRDGETVAGLRVLLIDDVLTTGATAAECARVLMRAGAARVGVVTLARATRGRPVLDEDPIDETDEDSPSS
ncbi:MAG: ComF family protein [Deltaproteobacteria bacterium]|nr:ComF family protein [Deltaproteobacteria bacterium]